MPVQLQYIQLIMGKTNAADMSSGLFAILTRMVQLPATAAIEYVAACCITGTRTITKTKTKTKTRTKIRTRTKMKTGTKK